MKYAFRVAVTCLAVVIGAFLAVDLHRVCVSAERFLNDADAAMIQAQATATNLNQTTAKINAAADSEVKEFQKTQAAIRLAVTFTDKNLNDPRTGAIPALRDMAQHLDANQAALAVSLERDSDDLHVELTQDVHPAIQNLTLAENAALADLSDPSIKSTLANIQVASLETSGVAKDVHTETSLLVGKTQDAFKPKNKALTILQMLIGNTVTGAELFYYLSH